MTLPGADDDLRVLANVSGALSLNYVRDSGDPWAGSPFAWILRRPSRQKGAIGEELVAQWCRAKGADVRRTGDSDADRLINGHRVEIKFSTLWVSGVYKFQSRFGIRTTATCCVLASAPSRRTVGSCLSRCSTRT